MLRTRFLDYSYVVRAFFLVCLSFATIHSTPAAGPLATDATAVRVMPPPQRSRTPIFPDDNACSNRFNDWSEHLDSPGSDLAARMQRRQTSRQSTHVEDIEPVGVALVDSRLPARAGVARSRSIPDDALITASAEESLPAGEVWIASEAPQAIPTEEKAHVATDASEHVPALLDRNLSNVTASSQPVIRLKLESREPPPEPMHAEPLPEKTPRTEIILREADNVGLKPAAEPKPFLIPQVAVPRASPTPPRKGLMRLKD